MRIAPEKLINLWKPAAVVLGIIFWYQVLYRGSFLHTLPQTCYSPDHQLRATARVGTDANAHNYAEVIVEIYDSNGKQIFNQDTGVSNAMPWSIKWVDNTQLELDSNDSGTNFIEKTSTGKWKLK